MSAKTARNNVWMIERRPLGAVKWYAVEWANSKAEGASSVRDYNRLIADCQYRLTKYAPVEEAKRV